MCSSQSDLVFELFVDLFIIGVEHSLLKKTADFVDVSAHAFVTKEHSTYTYISSNYLFYSSVWLKVFKLVCYSSYYVTNY